MKFLLIAIYISHAAPTEPLIQTRQYTDKATCQAAAKRYTERQVKGDKRAWCHSFKEPK